MQEPSDRQGKLSRLRRLRIRTALALAGSAAVAGAAQAQAPPVFCTHANPCASFKPFGTGQVPANSPSSVVAMSRDGSTVLIDTIGLYKTVTGETSGISVDPTTLPLLPAPSIPSSYPAGSGVSTFFQTNFLEALGLNADGTVVVGYVESGYGQYQIPNQVHAINFGGRTYAFVWSAASGAQRLIGTQGANAEDGFAVAMSDNGRVVVGWTSLLRGDIKHAQRWVNSGGAWSATDLGSLYNGHMIATGLSADGAVIVGTGSRTDGTGNAYRWTASSGLTNLGSLVTNGNSSAAAISGNGNVIVGTADTGRFVSQFNFPQVQAFRWTVAGEMVGLGAIGGDPLIVNSYAFGVNSDGSVIVGHSGSSPFSNDGLAFRWTQRTGM